MIEPWVWNFFIPLYPINQSTHTLTATSMNFKTMSAI